MNPVFFRIETDGTRTPVELRGRFAGPARTPCWIIGGGPSLAAISCDEIERSPVAKLSVNLCGAGLIRPTIWTAYDPTCRFHRSIYLDASILKLLPSRRAMDLVPDSSFKVCESPNLVFFEREPQRGFHDFPPSAKNSAAVVDWQDSLIQAIELAWWLGFRDLYLVGCELRMRPEPEHVALAAGKGLRYEPGELLKSFYDRCRSAGLAAETLERAAASKPYHFDETKSLAAAIQTDWHYFRVVQYLRLSRRAMSLAGLELISVTPGSRLNDFFPFRQADDVVDELLRRVGDPRTETTRGRYSQEKPSTCGIGPMRDFKPHNWPAGARSPTPAGKADLEGGDRVRTAGIERVRAALDELPEIAVAIDEVG